MAGIFISYRRSDAGGWAGRFSDSLRAELGRATILRDIDTIPPGEEFGDFIRDAVSSCQGPYRTNRSDVADGVRVRQAEASDPNDFTRIEIATALRCGVRVIPVLISNARLPSADDLADDLKPLARRQAYDTRPAPDQRSVPTTSAKLLTNMEPGAGVEPATY